MQGVNREWGGWLARQVLCVAIMLAVFGAIYIDAMGGDTPLPPMDRQGNVLPETPEARRERLQSLDKFEEDGVLESLQFAMLVAMSMTCVWIGMKYRDVRTVSLLFGGFFGMMAIREQDKWFDAFKHGSWKYPVIVLAVWMFLYAWRRWAQVKRAFAEYVRTASWGYFASGGLVTLVFSRLVGQKFLWNHMIASPRLARNMKDLVEEGTETAGYALMLCGLFEGIAHLRRRHKAESDV